MKYKKVEIIISTYNGEKYIDEQIKSLISQTYKNIKIIIRDDGSTDNTLKVLEKYKQMNNIEIHKSNNIGVVNSFFELLKLTSKDVDYVAFCDQDDVWDNDKISRAVELLQKEAKEIPLVYCSRVLLVDEDLKKINFSKVPKKSIGLGNALVENIVTGCTCVINQPMKNSIINNETKSIIMHDWWIYLVGSAIGKIVFDGEPTMYYRQHSNNTVGVSNSILKKWRKRIKNYRKEAKERKRTAQAKHFKKIYGDYLSKEQDELITSFINMPGNFLRRIKHVINLPVYRQNQKDNLLFKIMMILDTI